jgi:endonuclease-3
MAPPGPIAAQRSLPDAPETAVAPPTLKRRRISCSAAVPAGAEAPADWLAVLESLETSRAGRSASVDVFHGFLLGLRGEHAPFKALVAALLSVQCRDVVALQATTRLEAALGGDITPASVGDASVPDIEAAISCCNYKGSKARFVKRCAEHVATRFNSRLPSTVAELETLPGVGPKSTARCSPVSPSLTR